MGAPGRLRELFTENPVYYITACSYRRKNILACPVVHESFIRFSLNAANHGIGVGRYVIMPDHIHLFAAFGPESPSLSSWMKSRKNAISKSLTMATVRAPHWQKGFSDHVIRSGESYDQKWLYVSENPVRAGLVRSTADWPYAGEISRLSLL
jgi:putative transposase